MEPVSNRAFSNPLKWSGCVVDGVTDVISELSEIAI